MRRLCYVLETEKRRRRASEENLNREGFSLDKISLSKDRKEG